MRDHVSVIVIAQTRAQGRSALRARDGRLKCRTSNTGSVDSAVNNRTGRVHSLSLSIDVALQTPSCEHNSNRRSIIGRSLIGTRADMCRTETLEVVFEEI